MTSESEQLKTKLINKLILEVEEAKKQVFEELEIEKYQIDIDDIDDEIIYSLFSNSNSWKYQDISQIQSYLNNFPWVRTSVYNAITELIDENERTD